MNTEPNYQIQQLLNEKTQLEEEIEKLRKELTRLQNEMDERLQHSSELIEEQRNTYNRLLKKVTEKIKSPIQGILEIIDIIKPLASNTEIDDFIHIIESYISQVLSTVSDIIDYTTIYSQELQLNLSWISLGEFMENLSKIYKPQAQGKGLSIEIQIFNNNPLYLYTDEERLRQLLGNIIENAIKFTRQGRIKISINSLGRIGEKEIMVFEIKDTGIGISTEYSSDLLRALANPDITQLLKLHGEGLGLILIKELSLLLEGEVNFDSKVGEGTTFYFTAPFITKREEIPMRAVPLPDKKLKILLVEDNYLNQKYTKTSLLKAGYEVELAENGFVAVEKYQQQKFDLILMDVQLPLLDGIEATYQIREIEKQKDYKTPIIAVTAYAQEKDKKRCLEAGMDMFLAKPFKPAQLINLIKNLTENT
jgi:signal transduction histidine kinase/CheY-like chemotaxis protein